MKKIEEVCVTTTSGEEKKEEEGAAVVAPMEVEKEEKEEKGVGAEQNYKGACEQSENGGEEVEEEVEEEEKKETNNHQFSMSTMHRSLIVLEGSVNDSQLDDINLDGTDNDEDTPTHSPRASGRFKEEEEESVSMFDGASAIANAMGTSLISKMLIPTCSCCS